MEGAPGRGQALNRIWVVKMTFKDVNDLSEKIKRVLKDQKLREKLEAGARKYAEVAKLHLSLYEDTIKRSRLGGKS